MSNIYIGTAGWSIPGSYAEQFSGEGTHLVRYACKLNCTEINSSFHREHKIETYRKWAAAVPEEFRFAVKMPRAVTHEGKLSFETRPVVRHFLEQTEALGEKRGPILIQPPSFKFDADTARVFFAILREMYEGAVVFEPRHESWFHQETEELLREFRVGRVAADPSVVPPAVHPGGWTSLAYFRLHGSPRRYYSAYSTGYLQRLAAELRKAAAPSAWCILDNTASGAAVGNALELLSVISD